MREKNSFLWVGGSVLRVRLVFMRVRREGEIFERDRGRVGVLESLGVGFKGWGEGLGCLGWVFEWWRIGSDFF